MKRLPDENISDAPEAELGDIAQLAIDTSARLTRFVRRAVRSSPPSVLSLSRLRALVYVVDNPDVSVSELAENLLVGVPTASKLVDDLVEQELVSRSPDESDRRRLSLRATAEGERVLATAARPAQRGVAGLLSRLDTDQRTRVREALVLLRSLLDPSGSEVRDA